MRFPAATFLFLALGGCSLSGHHDFDDSEFFSPICSEGQPLLLSLGDDSPAGFSAEDLLFFSNQIEATGSWPAQLDESGGSPASEASFSLHISALGSEARWLESGLDDASTNPEAAAWCPQWLEVDVRAQVQMENTRGNWAFEFDTVLLARSGYLAVIDETINIGAVGNNAQFALDEGETLTALHLKAMFSPAGSAGTLEAIAEHTVIPEGYDPDAKPSKDFPTPAPYTTARNSTLVHWPIGNVCGAWESDYFGRWTYLFSLPINVSGDLLPDDFSSVLAPLNQETPLTWMDGSVSSITTVARPTATVACLTSTCGSYCSGEGQLEVGNRSALHIPTEFSAKSADGRLDGLYFGTVRSSLNPKGKSKELSFVFDERAIPVNDAAVRFGFPGFSLSGSDPVDFRFSVEQNEDNSPRGQLEMSIPGGLPPPECNPRPKDHPCVYGPWETTLIVEQATW